MDRYTWNARADRYTPVVRCRRVKGNTMVWLYISVPRGLLVVHESGVLHNVREVSSLPWPKLRNWYYKLAK